MATVMAGLSTCQKLPSTVLTCELRTSLAATYQMYSRRAQTLRA